MERKSVSPELWRKEHPPLLMSSREERANQTPVLWDLPELIFPGQQQNLKGTGGSGVGGRSPVPDGHWAILLEKVLLPSKVSHK